MTKTILMLGTTAVMAVVMATPSFAQNRNARDAYAQDFSGGYAPGWQSQNMPPQAAALWRPGQCWVDSDKLRRLGYFQACKK